MRLIFAAPAKNHVPTDDSRPLKRVMARAARALEFVQPWPDDNTEQDLRWMPPQGRVGIPLRSNELMRATSLNNAHLLNAFGLESIMRDLGGSLDRIGRHPVRGTLAAYIRNRTGRWLATTCHGKSVVNARATLLINNRMIRRILAAPDSHLKEERLAFGVMRVLSRDAAVLPFFRDRWEFESHGPSEFFDAAGWAARSPRTDTDKPMASFNWRTNFNRPLSRFFMDLFDSPNSMLFDVVNRRAVERMVGGERYQAPAARALFSVQYSLNNGWRDARPPSATTIQIEVPAA